MLLISVMYLHNLVHALFVVVVLSCTSTDTNFSLLPRLSRALDNELLGVDTLSNSNNTCEMMMMKIIYSFIISKVNIDLYIVHKSFITLLILLSYIVLHTRFVHGVKCPFTSPKNSQGLWIGGVSYTWNALNPILNYIKTHWFHAVR